MNKGHVLFPVKAQWDGRIFLKVAAWLMLASLATWACIWWLQVPLPVALVVFFILVFLAGNEWRKRPHATDVVQLVNAQFKPSEYSTELIFKDDAHGLEAIQRERVMAALHQSVPSFDYPVRWRDFLYVLAGLALLMVAGKMVSDQYSKAHIPVSKAEAQRQGESTMHAKDTVVLRTIELTIDPPAYTGLRAITTDQLHIMCPEQAQLTWHMSFDGEPTHVWVRTSAGDSLVAHKKNNRWTIPFRPKESGFYSWNFLQADSQKVTSSYYELQLVPDQPPTVTIAGIPQFQRLDYQAGLSFELDVRMADEYGLSDGYLVATITKGSGESVKFREQKMLLPPPVEGRKASRKITLKPDIFGMEPGNELYFYATTFDNRPGASQQTRTETFFIILKDTAQVEFSLQGALGVDLMPDYFRSQLQIILDTEKLIKDKKQLSARSFNEQSNALGYDQKQLRLKYGQFIGEEEDSGLEIDTHAEEEEEHEDQAPGENVLEEFGHDTDHENEEGEWMDRGTESQEKNPLTDFMHTHDDEETATFYTQTLKAKLKAALAQMWDAELYLRLYQPHKSLPYQYRAQELLNEIRNHARIYVQRIGFDPPPVNEAESRLTGKLREVNQGSFSDEVAQDLPYPAIRKAVVRLDHVLTSKRWSSDTRQLLQKAGDELAGLAIEQPGNFLSGLNLLRRLIDRTELAEADLREVARLKRILELAIDRNTTLPASTSRSGDDLIRYFVETLSKPTQK